MKDELKAADFQFILHRLKRSLTPDDARDELVRRDLDAARLHAQSLRHVHAAPAEVRRVELHLRAT